MSTATVTDAMLADELARVLQAGASSFMDRTEAMGAMRVLLRQRFAGPGGVPASGMALTQMMHAWACAAVDPAARATLDPEFVANMDAVSVAAEAALERALEVLSPAKPEGGAA